MVDIFIAWSGNQSLAYALQKRISQTGNEAVVGGGTPKDMFIGAQVIKQIDACTFGIVLVEDKGDGISRNLMFEWGYMLARFTSKNLHVILINQKVTDLPSDLQGTWVTEIHADRSSPSSDEEIAQTIFDHYINDLFTEHNVKYFDIISDWQNIRGSLSSEQTVSERQLITNILFGCLAAYYYGDNPYLFERLSHIHGSAALNMISRFARAYINVFIESDNMMSSLSEDDFLLCSETFEDTILYFAGKTDDYVPYVNILCRDVYGLATCLYLRNEGLEQEVLDSCEKDAQKLLKETLCLIEEQAANASNDRCLFLLLRAYIYNDLAHLHRFMGDTEAYLDLLEKSVNERQQLYITFMSEYPQNRYLAVKLEQEYVIALSEQCLHLEPGLKRRRLLKTIQLKYKEWRSEIAYTSSLTKRIEQNLTELEG